MNNTTKLSRVQIMIGEIPLSMLAAQEVDGSVRYVFSQVQVTEAIDRGEVYFRRFVNGTSAEASLCKHYTFEKATIEGNNSKINIVPIPVAVAYWKKEAISGNEKARLLMETIGANSVPPFEEFAGVYLVFPKKRNKSLIQDTESWNVSQLQEELGGVREPVTPAGKIDLLTATEVIEVKHVKAWKAALGQVEVYGDYYPSHTKRIHLFGKCNKSFLELIQFHCKKREIVITTSF